MFTIWANGEALHHPNLYIDGNVVSNPKFTSALNTHGSGTMVVPQTNPLYDSILPRKTYITVKNELGDVWRGRVISVNRGWNNTKTVYCEGELSYLTDSIQTPYGFKGSPEALLRFLISVHNAQMPDAGRRFTVGTVTVTDPNNNIVRSWSEPMNTWQAIEEKLLDTLGGYIILRPNRVIDYLSRLTDVSTQTVKFGENLLDLTEYISAENIVTCMYAYGAELDPDDPNYMEEPPENDFWDGNRLTIPALKANGSGDFAGFDSVSIWGEIWGSNTWDDVTVAANLKAKAVEWLKEQFLENLTIEARAVDLSILDVDIDKIEVGQRVHVISPLHQINLWLMCKSKTLSLTRPDQTVIMLGAGRENLSELQRGVLRKWKPYSTN